MIHRSMAVSGLVSGMLRVCHSVASNADGRKASADLHIDKSCRPNDALVLLTTAEDGRIDESCTHAVPDGKDSARYAWGLGGTL